jgi:hypothetical protein
VLGKRDGDLRFAGCRVRRRKWFRCLLCLLVLPLVLPLGFLVVSNNILLCGSPFVSGSAGGVGVGSCTAARVLPPGRALKWNGALGIYTNLKTPVAVGGVNRTGEEPIAIATQLTMDRLPRLQRLALVWQYV